MENLTPLELVKMIQRVFQPTSKDTGLALLVDLPDEAAPDTDFWKERRELAFDWYHLLKNAEGELGFTVALVLYRNPRMNNADLPDSGWVFDGSDLPQTADALDPKMVQPLESIYQSFSMFLAPTQFSATAPLKLLSRQFNFRAATMPGFKRSMIPALRLDYVEINKRVNFLKELVDGCQRADFLFDVEGTSYRLTLDLRHRTGHASGGMFPDRKVAGNLPSGETYIVPYEGEIEGDPSQSNGFLPVQFEDGVVVYEIQENRAIKVVGEEPAASREQAYLEREPAYGNMAELGLGVLSDFGLKPTGEILLDEKLGLHIAFGRSDHFGGQVGASNFSSPGAVVHIDRVYIPETQPRVTVVCAELVKDNGDVVTLIRDNEYVISFS